MLLVMYSSRFKAISAVFDGTWDLGANPRLEVWKTLGHTLEVPPVGF